MNKFDFVILIVVDEDDIEEINVKKIFEKKIILKSLDFYLVKCRKVDVIEKIKIQSFIIIVSDDKRKI